MKKESALIKVKGMTCQHCAITIKNAVKKLDGIVNVSIDMIKENVAVEFDQEKIELDQIKSTIEEEGYNIV